MKLLTSHRSGLLAGLLALAAVPATPVFACSLDDTLYSRCADSYVLAITQLATFNVDGGQIVSDAVAGPGGEVLADEGVYDPIYRRLSGGAYATGPTVASRSQGAALGSAWGEAQADATAGTIRIAGGAQPAGSGWDNQSFIELQREVSFSFSPTLAAPTVNFALSVTASSDLGGQSISGLFYGNVLVYRSNDPVNGLRIFDNMAGDFYNGTRQAQVSFDPRAIGVDYDIGSDGLYHVDLLMRVSLQGYGSNVKLPYSFVGDGLVALGASDGVTIGYADGQTPWVTPVPEPATWASMVFGLALVGVVARRRRR